jgi:hypothetical protein
MPARKSPAKKNVKVTKENPASVFDLIKLAEELGATSGFLADQNVPAEILAGIVRSRFPSLDDGKIADLISATSAAVTQLGWDRKQPNKKTVASKYSAVVESAVRLAGNLSIVLGDSSLEGPFLDLLVPNQNSPEQRDRLDRIRRHMVGDLLWFRFMVEPKIEIIRDTKLTRKDFEYRCAFRIAFAWLTATGEIPTLTRNTDAVSGSQVTAFQSYMIEAIKPGIGDAIVRKVVTELGDIVSQSSLSEIPKGAAGP